MKLNRGTRRLYLIFELILRLNVVECEMAGEVNLCLGTGMGLEFSLDTYFCSHRP